MGVRRSLSVAAASIVVGTGISLSLPSRSFVEPAAAAVRSLADLLATRSPGERAAGAVATKRPLVKAPRQRAKSLGAAPDADEAAGPVLALLNEAPAATPDVLTPPLLGMPVEADLLPPVILGGPMYGIGGGGGGSIGGGGGGGGGGGILPPGPGDLVPPPAVPEPSTWLTMVVGFGLLGLGLRWNRKSLRRGSGPRPSADNP